MAPSETESFLQTVFHFSNTTLQYYNLNKGNMSHLSSRLVKVHSEAQDLRHTTITDHNGSRSQPFVRNLKQTRLKINYRDYRYTNSETMECTKNGKTSRKQGQTNENLLPRETADRPFLW